MISPKNAKKGKVRLRMIDFLSRFRSNLACQDLKQRQLVGRTLTKLIFPTVPVEVDALRASVFSFDSSTVVVTEVVSDSRRSVKAEIEYLSLASENMADSSSKKCRRKSQVEPACDSA
jgi:hypothetical protein